MFMDWIARLPLMSLLMNSHTGLAGIKSPLSAVDVLICTTEKLWKAQYNLDHHSSSLIHVRRHSLWNLRIASTL